MTSHFHVTFPGGVRVDAEYRGHTIHTDQPLPMGENSALSPFDLFLGSVATCMGFYALRFCQERDISPTGLDLTLEAERDPETKRITNVRVDLQVPEGFPDKYESAIVRAMDQCAVKKVMANPPEFELRVVQPALST